MNRIRLEYLKIAKESFDKKYSIPAKQTATLADFELITVIGKGSYGCLMKGEHKNTKRVCAIKFMDKESIVKSNLVSRVLEEKNLIQAISFRFICQFYFSFQDVQNVYIVFQYVQCGDLYSILTDQSIFSEAVSKFYSCQLLMAIDYLHSLNIAHRDLKPENILIDEHGYLKLTDFGFAKIIRAHTFTMCGTPYYMAPEIILQEGYRKDIDWWAFGIIIFEMSAGHVPFIGEMEIEIFENIVHSKLNIPETFSKELFDLCNQLLCKDITRRFGCLKNGVLDIARHRWFEDVNWESIYQKKARAKVYTTITDEIVDATQKLICTKIKLGNIDQYKDLFVDF